MRTPSTGAQDLLNRIAAGEQIAWVQLIEMQLSETLRFTTAGRDVEWGGYTWLRNTVAQIEPIEDSSGELLGLRFTQSGVRSSDIAIALVEPVEGKVIRVWDAVITPGGGDVAYAELVWAGTLNVPEFSDGPTAVISCTAEHRGVLAVRPKPRLYSGEEQLRRYPGDTSLNIDPAIDAGPVVWPKASWGRQ